MSSDDVEHGKGLDNWGDMTSGRWRSLTTFSNGVSFSATSFSASRSLSSEAGRKTSDGEAELEDGFSELETPMEADEAKESAGEEDLEGFDLETDLHEDDSTVSVATDLGLTDTEADTSSDKFLLKGSPKSQLSKVLVEAPRHSFTSTLDKWVKEGKPLGRSEIAIAVLVLRKRRMFWKALQLLEWLEANKRLDYEERDYASRVDLIAKVHGLHRAEKYIEKIPESFRGERIYRTLLANCVSSVNIKKAEEVFNKIRDLGFPLSVFACNQMLLLYKRLDRKKIADVLLLMEKENIKPSVFTYRLLIDTKGRANDITGMEKVLETMKADGIEPTIPLQAMVARHYIYGGLKEKAEAVLREMEGSNIEANRDACKELLTLYASLGKADDVARVWKACGTNPRVEECLAAIEAWGKLGHIENAEAVLEEMLKTVKKPSARYYNVLLKVYANHKLLAKGKDLAKRMADSKCNIGPFTWDALVKLYVEAGEVEKADSVLQKASQQNKLKPLYSTYMTVLDKYAQRGDIHNAEKVFHRMKLNGYTGRMRQYQALLQAYINAKTPAYGFRERLKADNMFPNRAVATQLADVDAFKKTEISELLD